MRPLPREMQQRGLTRAIRKLALRMCLRHARQTRHVEDRARVPRRRGLLSLIEQREQRSGQEVVRGHIARVGHAPCVGTVTDHPFAHCVCVCEIDGRGLGFGVRLGGDA